MSNIKNLVFSGGGVKIFIFAGCLKYMYENNLIDNLEAICGTSTGSIISTGTPAGTGMEQTPQQFLKLGDKLSLKIDHLGEQNYEIVEDN